MFHSYSEWFDGYNVPGVYTVTDLAIFSPDKPNQTAAAETVKTQVLPSKPPLPAMVQSPEAQKESPHTAEASHLEMSVAGAVERGTLPPNLTETQG